MGQLVVEDLDDRILESLKARAAHQDRSLEAEVRVILEHAVAEPFFDIAEARKRAERISRSLEGRPHSDSASLIRDDRDR